eukprot:m.247982 g.247982  ORF g.247982 m.247982 type:complete len:68 (+) comp19501_c0_seq11:1785-1988(+)
MLSAAAVGVILLMLLPLQSQQVSGLRRDVNNWDKVDDFNWLNPTEASPNWSIMPPGAQQHRILPQSE